MSSDRPDRSRRSFRAHSSEDFRPGSCAWGRIKIGTLTIREDLPGAARSRRDRVVPLGSSSGRDEASGTARTDFAAGPSRRSWGLRVSPCWGIVAAGTETGADPIGGPALDQAKTRGEEK